MIRRTGTILVWLAALSAWMARPASGQTTYTQTRAPILEASEVAALTEQGNKDLASILTLLYSDYRGAHEASWHAAAGRVAGSATPGAGALSVRGITADWNPIRRRLLDEFAGHVESVLQERLRPRWERVIQEARRRDWLRELDPTGSDRRLDDPFAYVDALDLPPDARAAVDEVRREHLTEFSAIVERLRAEFDPAIDALHRARAAGDEAAAERASKRTGALRKAVRDAMARARERVSTVLPPEERAAFEGSQEEAVLPQLYRQTAVDLAMEAVREWEAVPAPTVAAMEARYETYRRARDRLRERVLRECYRWSEPEAAAEREALKARIVAEAERRGEKPNPTLLLPRHSAMPLVRELVELDREECERMASILRGAGLPRDRWRPVLRVLLSGWTEDDN